MFRKLTEDEQKTILEAIRRIPKIKAREREGLADSLTKATVTYRKQDNFTIAILKSGKSIYTGCSKRNMGGIRRQLVDDVYLGDGIPESDLRWDTFRIPPEEENTERAQAIALSRAVKSIPVEVK